jgi:signal transduction histidine kinase
VGTWIARVRRIDLAWLDRAAAAMFAVGAVADASSQPHRSLGVIGLASLLVLMSTIAWRRAYPAMATFVAVSALSAFTIASRYHGDGSFEVAAIALDFYMLGRRSAGRSSLIRSAALLAYWAAGAAVVTYVPPRGTVGSFVGGWALAGVLPFAVGWMLERRRALAGELTARAVELRDEQEFRARGAVVEERYRMARELHDVIAHCVSVMVVQTQAARRIASIDSEATRNALGVVERSGREALVELRRMVGALDRRSDDPADTATPGLGQLEALAGRARAAGLPVDVRVQGQPAGLPPEVDLVAYRVVQEALTNAIKHAGSARAIVTVVVGTDQLELVVADDGRGPDGAAGSERAESNGSGHGLAGMAERVGLFGGALRAGARPGGGFEVEASIPLRTTISAPRARDREPTAEERQTGSTEPQLRWPWLDAVIALVFLVALEIGVLAASHRHGPLTVDLIVAAVIALAAVWRRRWPLAFLIVVGVLGSVMNAYLVELKNSPVVGAYFVLVPSYAIAAWAEGREAALGLGILLGGAAVSELITDRGQAGDFVGAAFAVTAAWAAGRAVRSYRLLTSELARTSQRLAVEREDRARLAVAAERSRIARGLHAAVAGSVASMVVLSQAALRQFDSDPAGAERSMDAVERTGRLALADMRRILGVLRHGEHDGQLRPQPGVDQIYPLVERARENGQPVELTVDGNPGTLSPGIELGLYRILESALHDIRPDQQAPVIVRLRFGAEALDVHLAAGRDGPNEWPTGAMRERVLLCGGRLDREPSGVEGWRFSASLPCAVMELHE